MSLIMHRFGLGPEMMFAPDAPGGSGEPPAEGQPAAEDQPVAGGAPANLGIGVFRAGTGALLGAGNLRLGAETAIGGAGATVSRSLLGQLRQADTIPATVFVEVGQSAEQAAISRDGIPVREISFNPDTLGTALGTIGILPTRVITQSIPPGTSVPKGTTVDLAMTEAIRIPVGVLQNPFVPLADRNLDDVYKTLIRDNPTVTSVLARNASADVLNEADQATLTQALANSPITTSAGSTITEAFATLQAAYTFGS